ncbi:TRAP transporter small permease (plasmid) [Phyllobacterium sp. A18/5-2]|uniref:TRAP transporter small permease n=1 Tax=Phyllobacterium sp. A18/5-2 TaxID=2978392 RepID=UPI0021CA6881|nr:TRAP transporter small permease [Phyllobacterium sp. A18/5-2]UXN66722.1 TRAP transporter small permease [Phyllobacterium sp. A18/5-2]
MTHRLEKLSNILSRTSTAALYLAGIGLVLMTAFVAWQVFGRYVLNRSPSWTEPAAVMLMSWFIFLGAAVGVRENFHLGFDVLLYVLPEGSKAILRTASDVIVAAFGFGMVWYGCQLVSLTWASTLPSLGLPGGFDYLPVVAGGALILLFSLERMVQRFAGVGIDRDLNLEEVPDLNTVQEA